MNHGSCYKTPENIIRSWQEPVKAAREMMPDAEPEAPYEGAKEMLLVNRLEDRDFLCGLLEAMYDELPLPKKRKK